MADRIAIDIADAVAHVRLARPEKLNAIDLPMFVELVETGKAINANRGVRAVVLSGEGRAFCAGLDFSAFAAMAGTSASEETASEQPVNLLGREPDSLANLAQRAAWIWREVHVPVLAAVHGVAYGGGLQIACGADMRYVHPEARMSVREIQWGLIPDMSATQTLRHLVRIDVARELTYTGRVISGQQALELGLATRVCDDPLAEAQEIARQIARQSPDAIRAAKRLWNEAPALSHAEGLKLEEQLQLSLIGKPNQVEAVMANLQKREPRFED